MEFVAPIVYIAGTENYLVGVYSYNNSDESDLICSVQ